jgi:ABC-type lipoprotein release transport system permease subunit
VLLSLLGIYSVIAFSAALRTREMAIRLALGSQRASVMRLVLSSGAKLGLVGCGIGILASVFATRLLRNLLFQVDPLDPTIIVLAAFSICLFAPTQACPCPPPPPPPGRYAAPAPPPAPPPPPPPPPQLQ